MFQKFVTYYRENLDEIAMALAAFNGDYDYLLRNR